MPSEAEFQIQSLAKFYNEQLMSTDEKTKIKKKGQEWPVLKKQSEKSSIKADSHWMQQSAFSPVASTQR